ncbi:MAG: hypothetical protein NC181_02430 [Clostridium sp.]|nr:hypothetical protein [Clostridium sp.]MCM1443740.1 hypothetical protein [Candidatus Amulumruptor caecigallinarius]
MKYLLLIFVFFLTACSKTNLDINEIRSITYNETKIIEDDFSKITNNLMKLEFTCTDSKTITGSHLKIITNNNIYNIYISDNYYMEFMENDKYCLSKDENIKEISEELKDIEKIYNDDTFFNIVNTNKYEEDPNDLLIKVDKSDNYIIINTSYELYDFKINEIKINDNDIINYEEVNLIYENEHIKNFNIIIRKSEISNIKITFRNKYNYLVTIIPYLEDDEIKFNITFKQK